MDNVCFCVQAEGLVKKEVIFTNKTAPHHHRTLASLGLDVFFE